MKPNNLILSVPDKHTREWDVRYFSVERKGLTLTDSAGCVSVCVVLDRRASASEQSRRSVALARDPCTEEVLFKSRGRARVVKDLLTRV